MGQEHGFLERSKPEAHVPGRRVKGAVPTPVTWQWKFTLGGSGDFRILFRTADDLGFSSVTSPVTFSVFVVS